MASTHSTKLLTSALLAALFAPGCTPDDEALLEDGDDDVAAADESLVAGSGERIELEGLAILAPRPGTSVWTERLFDDGTTQQVMLHTDLAGVVYVEQIDDHPAAPGDLSTPVADGTAALAACSDSSYTLNPYRWNKTLRWYFNADSTPSEITKDNAELALKLGTSNITASDNGCSMTDQVSATHEFLGRLSATVNINSGGDCLTNDNINMVGFGDLPTGVLAVACVWFSDGIALESDIRLNKADHSWTTSPTSGSCSNRFSVEAVMTHERGHSFGLGHVSEATHGNLTMSTQIAPCQNGESTLGKGDVLALRAHY